MNRTKMMRCWLVLTTIAWSTTSFNTITRPPQKQPLRTIVIDPGHGGFDPGTHGLFSKEKNVTLAISLKLGKAIKAAFPDIKIVYTRTTDIMPGNASDIHEGLRYRAELANRSRGDLFICIHANSNGRPAGSYEERHLTGYKWVKKRGKKVKLPVYTSKWIKNTTTGAAVYIWKADRSGTKSTMIGEENMGDTTAIDMDSPEARIRAQLYEKKYFGNSALFGSFVHDEFIRSGRHSQGLQQRATGIWVLEATGMPSVLIETGYLTNKEEEKYLNSRAGQNKIVQNIVTALKRYNASRE
ncbi:MAG TPA: N-acetylmuramoyl-L-alanine amidase [Puia sp.]|nr:N-acetylmuramoyl-L-alanine amidase [Puia sp.]